MYLIISLSVSAIPELNQILQNSIMKNYFFVTRMVEMVSPAVSVTR